jgi:hypothetical protein
MSVSHSAEELQEVLQGILKSPPVDYFAEPCSEKTTLGRSCGPCMHLDAVDMQLYAYLEEINKLLKIQAEAKQRVNQHHDPLTRHLPVEISSYIFSIYTDDVNSDFDPQSSIIGRDGPLVLAAVSKTWRRVAFSTPDLWSTVNIHIRSSDNLRTKAELTKEWLAQSRRLPLHLSLVYRTSNVVEPEPNPLILLFNLIQKVSPRWCKLVLEIPPTFYTAFFREVTCAPTLETLKLFDDAVEEGDEAGDFHLPRTPSLKHLDIRLCIPFSVMSIDWSTLTTVEANKVLMEEYFDILRLSERLESFRLRGLIGQPGYSLPTTPITHSALRELYLETSDESWINPSELVTMLKFSAFPSLEKFGYNSSIRSSFPNSALPSIFSRSRCRLTHFDLCGDLQNGTTDDLISILSDLPTITHFKLEDKYSQRLDDALMSNKLLRRLTPIGPSEVIHIDRLLPRLESLEFVGYKAFSWSCLASVVSATTLDGSPDLRLTPERPECTNSIRHISFSVYMVEEMERIDIQSLAHLQRAHRAGTFHCQVFRGEFKDQVIDPFGWEDDHRHP